MRRALAIALVLSPLGLFGAVLLAQRPQPTVVEVFKTPTCGCCANWVKHLEQNGFRTKVTDLGDLTQIKNKHGVPGKVESCHTALVGGYIVEGHVPAADIQKLLKAKPGVAGIAVPGMPVGSPGMEQGSRVDSYNVVTFTKDGQTNVFTSYARKQ
jgi:hypothetical protein